MIDIFTELIYYLYKTRLSKEIKRNKILPSHVGLIMDGNRRYAKKKGKDVRDGHRKGANKIDELLNWCENLKIPMITIWALSTDNLKRQSAEINDLLRIIEEKITAISRDPHTHRRRMKIKVLGKIELLPDSTIKALASAEKETKNYNDYCLNVAIGYGGREEIADALKNLLISNIDKNSSIDNLINEITPDAIGDHLYTVDLPDPDLIIRTSGETRLSGFLLWQSAYSEFYFCDAYWPAFRQIDFLRAIRSYQQRQRRFGQ